MRATSQSQRQVLRTLTRHAVRRNPVTAGVLMFFVALATALASASGIVVVTATGASESLMEQARTPHFLQMHAGPVDEERMARFAESNPHVVDHAVIPMLNVDGAAIRVTNGDRQVTLADSLQDNAFVTQNASFDHLLDTNSHVIDPQPGTVWLPLFYQQRLALSVGDTVTVSGPANDTDLTVAGFLRDSQMNSSYSSSKRLLVATSDFDSLQTALGRTASVEHLIEFRLTGADVVGEFDAQYREAGLEANGPTVTWTLFVLVNSLSSAVTAAVIILVTLILVLISLLCVRFTILTTIEQDQREIGVLKAIGVRTRDLRRLYAHRYLAMSGAGAIGGLVASVGLSQFLLHDVRLFQGTSGRSVPAAVLAVVVAGVIVAVIALAVGRFLRRLESVSAVQAIRASDVAAGRRRPRRVPRWLTVAHSRLGTNVLLGLRDVVRRPRQFAVPVVIYALATFILIIPQNLHATVSAPSFVTYMGAGISDMSAAVPQAAGADTAARLDRELERDPRVSRHTLLSTAMYTAHDAAGKKATVKIQSGDLAAFPISYLTGSAPTTRDHVAVSSMEAAALGVDVGEQVVVTPARPVAGGADLTLTVTGIYQDITHGGRTAKMIAPHTSGQLLWATVLADFGAGVDVDAAVDSYQTAHPEVQIASVAEYVDATLGGTIASLRVAALGSFLVGVLVSALITVLFLRLTLIRDRTSVTSQQVMGFGPGHIRQQYVVRALAALVIGVLAGMASATIAGGALAGGLLSSVGLSQIDVTANPWLAYLASPAALVATVAIATLTSTRLIGSAQSRS